MGGIPAVRLCLWLLAWISGGLQAEGLKPAYQLRSEALVHGPNVTAADLLEPVPKGELGRVKLARLGKPGSEKVYSRDQVQKKLNRALRGLAPVIGGSRCTVKASVMTLAGKDLLNFGERHLRERLVHLTGTARIEIASGKTPRDRRVPNRSVNLHIRAPLNPRYRGAVVLTVIAKQTDDEGQEHEVASVPLSFKVKVEEEQLVAARPIRRGERLGPKNTTLAWRDTTFQREPGFQDLAEVEGFKARRRIPAERVVTRSLVALPPLVKKGEQVWLVVQSRGVRLETRAVVLQDGQQDDMVLVEVTNGGGRDGKKKLRARVVDAGTVLTITR